MKRRVLAVVVAAVLLTALGSLSGAPLAGSDDTDFKRTVATWLQDNDRDSLPQLSRLAQNGNVAARLLLARIETTERAPSAYVAALTRRQRVDLFRPPGNQVLRPSWLQFEADRGNAFATSLLAATALGINIPAIAELYAAGEPQAAEHLIRKVAVDGTQAQRQQLAGMLASDDELAPYLRGFQYSHAGETTGRTALEHITRATDGPGIAETTPGFAAAAEFVDIGYQAGGGTIDFSSANAFFATLADWVMTAPEATPFAALCRHSCADGELSACATTAFGLAGGYYEVIRFDSPLESVIVQASFLESPRAAGMALRRITFAKTENTEEMLSPQELRERSDCLATAIERVRVVE